MKQYKITANGRVTKVYVKSVTDALRTFKDLQVRDISKTDVESTLNGFGYNIKRWYKYDTSKVAVIDPSSIKSYSVFNANVRNLKKYAKSVYADDNEIVFENPVFTDSVNDSMSKFTDSKFFVEVGGQGYSEKDAKDDARKYGLQLKYTGKLVKRGPNEGAREAYLIGPRANLIKMLNEHDLDEFIHEIEDSVNDSMSKFTEKNLEDSVKGSLVARLYKSAFGDPNYRRVQLLLNGKEVASLTQNEARALAATISELANSATNLEDSIKDDVVSNYFYFDLDDTSMPLDNAINIMKNCGLTIVKINKHGDEAEVYYRGTSAAEQKAADKLDIFLDD